MSASKDWLLEKLSPLAPCKERLSLLGTTARSVEQGCEGINSLTDEAGFTGLPGLFPETPAQCPGEKHTHTKAKRCYHSKPS